MGIVGGAWGIISLIMAIFLPPIGVLMHNGISKDLIISILLTLLGYIPGIIWSVYVIITRPATMFGVG